MANDLMEMINEERKNSPPPPEDEPTEPDSEKSLSKSKRVQEYLKENPETRNVDVVEALREYGVTAGDVSNVKTKMRKKSKKSRTSTSSAGAGKAAKAAKPSTVLPISLDAKIEVDLLELAVEFVRKAGGMNEAQHILNLVRRIRSL